MASFKANESSIYLTDNGAAYCGEHLGANAKYTGYDISGQPIVEMTPEIAMEEWRVAGFDLKCEEPRCERTTATARSRLAGR